VARNPLFKENADIFASEILRVTTTLGNASALGHSEQSLVNI